jgi:hypothetical protein
MGSLNRWKGKNVVIDPKNPEPLGICDRCGFNFNHKDLVKQKDWQGDNYIWIGILVCSTCLDKPQEQNRPPLVKDDPRPVKNPRPPILYTDPNSNPVLPNAQLMAKLQSIHWGG